MNSLRSRLILGFAVIAVIPLAVAMLLLSQRIQASVRRQAADRLAATLGMLQMELRAADTQGLGEEGQTGRIGCPLHWRGCQA